MKFGKYIQKKQLEIPDFAASFVNYKALKKLIKGLARSPVPENEASSGGGQTTLQDNRATFFFRLDQELYKVQGFYHLKETEVKARIGSLIEKQRSLRMRISVISRDSSNYISLEQGFKDFIEELHKLEQFMEINATAFSKILKKWDKLSKSQTREVYLSRAYEVQPGFNREVISELQDQANSALLDCAAWAEGEDTTYGSSISQLALQTPRLEQDETDSDLLNELNSGNISALTGDRGLIGRVRGSHNSGERLSKAFLSAISTAPDDALQLVLDTQMVDMKDKDDINARNSLHKAAMTGRANFVQLALDQGVDPKGPDAYGRTPLHYACMNGHVQLIDLLLGKHAADMLELTDLNGYTPLIWAITNSKAECVKKLLQVGAKVDRAGSEGQIPINLACKFGDFEIISMLLQRKPKLIPDAEGLYPQHLAARCGCVGKTLVSLQEHGAHLDQADKLYAWTPLFHAADAGHKETLSALLELNVDPTVLDEKDLTAQYYAIWEGHLDCMDLLAKAVKLKAPRQSSSSVLQPMQGVQSAPATSIATPAIGHAIDAIPDLSLGPPMVPAVKWGHNFLKDQKTIVMFSFVNGQRNAVTFYDPSKYPAARLTIVPKDGDIPPRNIALPFTEDNRGTAFEMDDFANFAVDFDIYPTFGRTLIAKGSVPGEVFRGARSSSGTHQISLFDPRLRSIGELVFQFQIIKPFPGDPLDPKQTYLYWKAASNTSSTNLNTGSSLSGQYIRLYVQLSSDGVPVLYPYWTVKNESGLHAPVMSLTFDEFKQVGAKLKGTELPGVVADACANPELLPQTEEDTPDMEKKVPNMENLRSLHRTLALSYTSLANVLQMLPLNIQVEIHVMYPTLEEEAAAFIRPKYNLNETVDKIVKEVFDHARTHRSNSGHTRGIVFTSYNKDLCTALNWKQPNFPVLLCNDLGAPLPTQEADPYDYRITSDGKSSMSIKEAVRVAGENNLMGLVCRSQILDMVPALINAIKHAGLVLTSDTSGARMSSEQAFSAMPEGADGILMRNGVMHYNKTHDM